MESYPEGAFDPVIEIEYSDYLTENSNRKMMMQIEKMKIRTKEHMDQVKNQAMTEVRYLRD